MPLTQNYIQPGIFYEIWEGALSPLEIFQSQDAYLKRMEMETLPLYVVIVEIRKNATMPPISTFMNEFRRFPRERLCYHIVITSHFNKKLVQIVGPFINFNLQVFKSYEVALAAAQAAVSESM